MFKNKNRVTKISNGILLVMFIMSSLSCISLISNLISGNIPEIEGYTEKDCLFDSVVMIVYSIVTGVTLLLLNKKVNLYKEEYALSRQIFNLFIVLSLVSSIIVITSVISTYFVYNEFSLYNLSLVLFGYLPAYIISYFYVKNKDFLSEKNSKKTNVVNFLVIYMIITYSINVVSLMLQLILKLNDVILIIQNICISFIWICVVLIAYKMLNRDNKEVTLIASK